MDISYSAITELLKSQSCQARKPLTKSLERKVGEANEFLSRNNLPELEIILLKKEFELLTEKRPLQRSCKTINKLWLMPCSISYIIIVFKSKQYPHINCWCQRCDCAIMWPSCHPTALHNRNDIFYIHHMWEVPLSSKGRCNAQQQSKSVCWCHARCIRINFTGWYWLVQVQSRAGAQMNWKPLIFRRD